MSIYRVKELGPGPTEIRRRVEGEDELIGYGLVIYDEQNDRYDSYFVIDAQYEMPIPLDGVGTTLTFKVIEAPSDSPEEFDAWVAQHGGLGEVSRRKAVEEYSDWKP